MRIAVLATIIEHPGWRYDIASRFDARYGRMLRVTDRRVYQVVDDLLSEGLIEVIGEDPRRHFGPTELGRRTHATWLAAGIREDHRRIELRVSILAASVCDREATLVLLDQYEAAIRADMSGSRAVARDLQSELIDRERRMVNEAGLRFVAYARERLAREP